MEQTVYGDILFFVNFCMDFQCLFLTAGLLHRPFSPLRGAVASAIGALYACAALFLSVGGTPAFLADCGVCLLMCVLTFGARGEGARRVLGPFAVYFGVSAAVGGAMSAIANLLSRVELPLQTDGAELSAGAFFLLAILGGGATFVWGRLCQRRAKGRRARLTLTFLGRTRELSCVVDTANLLRDPAGGRPVALLDIDQADFLPSALLAVVKSGRRSALAELPMELASRVRLIPAKTATGEGTLLAFAPDEALLATGGDGAPVELLLAPVPLAVGREAAVLLPAELFADI